MRSNTVGQAVLVLLLACACLGNDASFNNTGPTRPAGSAGIIQWSDPAHTADLGGGWTARVCEDAGSFLCIEREGVAVGTVEALSFPLSSFEDLNPAAATSVKLNAFAGGFHEAVRSDRTAGCPADYGVEFLGPERFRLAGEPGMFYGFVGTLGDGAPSELNVQYASIVGDQVIVLAAIAYDEGGCPGRDDLSSWDSIALSEFRPFLEPALENSPLPVGGG